MMGETTAIAWCHATFNPWWGCVEVSPGCDHCYARADAKRYGHAVWGRDVGRRFFSDKHWDGPLRWDRRARAEGRRIRVFCASMADVLEERDDAIGRDLDQARRRLWQLIAMTEATDWLLLTKRPRNFKRLVPAEILALTHVWPGTTVESAAYLWRIEQLRQLDEIAAGPLWLSHEPALEGLDLRPYLPTLNWVVIGGESQGGARPFCVDWARVEIQQCRNAGVPVFVKQLGAHPIFDEWDRELLGDGRLKHRKAGDPAEWPEDLRVREFPR